jgi:hypothetical protein
MSLIDSLMSRFRPPHIDDPAFGRLLFMRIKRNPSRSYWEGEWLFPPTGTQVEIALPGPESGPLAEARDFYLGLAARFDAILIAARSALDDVFHHCVGRSLSENLWDDLTLAGFGIEDLTSTPAEWDISFETTGEKWLGVTVPFIGDLPQPAIVDT